MAPKGNCSPTTRRQGAGRSNWTGLGSVCCAGRRDSLFSALLQLRRLHQRHQRRPLPNLLRRRQHRLHRRPQPRGQQTQHGRDRSPRPRRLHSTRRRSTTRRRSNGSTRWSSIGIGSTDRPRSSRSPTRGVILLASSWKTRRRSDSSRSRATSSSRLRCPVSRWRPPGTSSGTLWRRIVRASAGILRSLGVRRTGPAKRRMASSDCPALANPGACGLSGHDQLS
mmetsp:Transcript_54599/g.123385  ORF Transcript_54599/g.123385 Transcript_54599/m.123385 type:complete len:224 (+) Transcript_54599:971-1642(+)